MLEASNLTVFIQILCSCMINRVLHRKVLRSVCVFGGSVIFYFDKPVSVKRRRERATADGRTVVRNGGKGGFVATSGMYFSGKSTCSHDYDGNRGKVGQSGIQMGARALLLRLRRN